MSSLSRIFGQWLATCEIISVFANHGKVQSVASKKKYVYFLIKWKTFFFIVYNIKGSIWTSILVYNT